MNCSVWMVGVGSAGAGAAAVAFHAGQRREAARKTSRPPGRRKHAVRGSRRGPSGRTMQTWPGRTVERPDETEPPGDRGEPGEPELGEPGEPKARP